METLDEALRRLESQEDVDFSQFPIESLLEAGRGDFYYLTERIERVVEARLGIPQYLCGPEFTSFWREEVGIDEIINLLQPKNVCLRVLGYGGPKTLKLFRVAPRERIQWARHLNLGDENLIQRVLEKNTIPFRWWICRLLVESFSTPVRLRLVHTPISQQVLDTIEEILTRENIRYEEVKELKKRIRNWEDLLAGLRWLIDTRETRLPISPRFRSIDGAKVGELTLKLPKTVDYLVKAGRILDNCLTTYAPKIRSGCVVILVEEEESTPRYALEIYGGYVRQFEGPHHTEVPSGIKISILEFLQEKGLIKSLEVRF